MPWKVVPNHPDCPESEPFGVVNAQTGRKVACHMTEADAARHVRALYANVPESQNSRPTRGESMPTELRYTPVPVELRSGDGQPAKIVGYAARFRSASKNLGGFKEEIDPIAFNRSASRGFEGLIARYNHDDNFILGSVSARTLRAYTDDQGLRYEIDPPLSRADVVESIQRGDVGYSSFAFYSVEDDWTVDDTNFPRRTLLSVDLVDVSPVVRPAYEGTNVDLALASYGRRFEIPFEEVRLMAVENKLHKALVRTDHPTPTRKVFGAQARMDILRRKQDPNA